MTDCDEYCANHGCNQGRNCPARSGGKCHCTPEQTGVEFSKFELLLALILTVLILYFAMSVAIHWVVK